MIQFRCPKCKTEGKASDEVGGTVAKCRKCGISIRLPKRQAAPPPLPVTYDDVVLNDEDEEMEQDDPWAVYGLPPTIVKIGAGIVAALLLGIVLALLPDKPHKPKEQVDVPKQSPLGTIERTREEIQTALGKSNREVTRLTSVSESNGNVEVKFAINDNVTEGFIKLGVQRDICSILKALKSAGFNYRRTVISASFPMQDKYGNTSESEVIRGIYSEDEVRKINWDNFLQDNIFDIADSIQVHPQFR